MKYFAILKDSLKETIDSSVFFVVLGFSALAILLMATVSFEPNSPVEGLNKLADKFPDGRIEANLPVVGKLRVGEPMTRFEVKELGDVDGVKKPWEHEYDFVLEGKDVDPMGTRIAVLLEILREEDRRQKANPLRKTRLRKLQEEVGEEVERIQERDRKRGGGNSRFETEIRQFIAKRLTEEAATLKPKEMEDFVALQLRNQGNWDVADVKFLELPENERKIVIERRIVVPDKDGEVKTKTEKVDGEVTHFRVKLKSKSGTYRVWPHRARILFGAIPLGSSSEPGEFVHNIILYGVGYAGAPLIMLLACVITAFYIPNMLRKGTIDLLLAKPITRFSLLWYKYVGGLTFMFVNTVFLITGVWVALGLRSGIWEPTFLLLIPVLTFQFAMFYALSTLLAVMTRSAIVCILGCVLLYGILTAAGLAYGGVNFFKDGRDSDSPGWFTTTARVAHGALPHYNDLFWLTNKQIYLSLLDPAEGPRAEYEKGYEHYNWGESIGVTSLWIVVFLALAYWRFAVKDY